MNPELLLRATALALLLRLSFSTPDGRKAESCEPKSCGNGGVNISYPFWINGQHPSYCGFPQFSVNCSGQTPVLAMVYNQYHVRRIFYNNQSLIVSVTQINEPTNCALPFYNLSFSLTPFTISTSNRGLYLIRHCEGSPLGSYEVSCGKGGTFAYIGGGYWSPEHPGSSNKCGNTTVVPVVVDSAVNGSDYKELLENGFLLNWTAANCTECRASKGQCGYDEKEQRFMCICHDRIHAISCKVPENKSKTKSLPIEVPENKSKKKYIRIGAGVGAAMLATLCLTCFFCFWFKLKTKRQNSISNSLIKSTPSDPSSLKDAEFGSTNYLTQIFSYKELHEATDGFDANQELGDGGFGTVYKGKLRDGRVVAVKRLYENNFKRVEQFMNEVEILSRLRHQFLVTLYGCTSRHSRELLLVYEFVSNGTVADHIHGPHASHGSLTWALRLNIAIESADALAYLHNIEPQIIHRDVKTNNILLDNSFHVKVADFGLSRLFPVDATHVSTLPQGTPGYVDPDYHQCYQLTDKSDVYSFGVVLIELISSKPAIDIGRHHHEINLANLAINKIQNRELEELIDPGLGYRLDPEMEMMINMVAELAFRCLQGEKEMRPPIKEVLEELRRIQSWGYNKDKESEADFQMTEDVRLLKNIPPCSPNSVTLRWESHSTTPNTST